MSDVLKALVTNLFDHAGLFPPTARPFEEAYQFACSMHREFKRPEIIASEMVLGFDSLSKSTAGLLNECEYPANKTFRISVLAPKELEEKSANTESAEIINKIKEFNRSKGSEKPTQLVKALDFKISNTLIQSKSFEKLVSDLNKYGEEIRIFFEPDLSIPQWEDCLSRTIGVLDGSEIGLKCRGTGPTGIANSKMAEVLRLIAKNKIHYKVTGGFHHMVAGAENAAGFLNYVGAFVLAGAGVLNAIDLESLLSNRDLNVLGIKENSLNWKNIKFDSTDIAKEREQRHISIGCCNPLTPDQELYSAFGAPNKN